jgi:hypothetical protein
VTFSRAALVRGLSAAFTGLLAFGALSHYRTQLIARGATGPEREWLLAGDEPTYLLMALAMARGDGQDVGPAHASAAYTNLYARNPFRFEDQWTWAYYTNRGYGFLISREEAWENRRVTQFSPLLPLLLVPFVSRAENARWAFCTAQTLGVAAGCAALLLLLFPGNPVARRRGVLTLLAGGFGIPIGYYTCQVFPEILTGGLLLGALACLRPECGPCSRAVGHAMLIASLWATPRVVPAVTLLAVLTAIRPSLRASAAEAFILPAGLAAYAAFSLATWGNPVAPQLATQIRAQWQSAPLSCVAGMVLLLLVLSQLTGMQILSRRGWGWLAAGAAGLALFLDAGWYFVSGVAGFFLSRQTGLLLLHPFLSAGVVLAALWFREGHRGETTRWLAIIAGLVLPVAMYDDPRAGVCPAGRYQVLAGMLLLWPMLRMGCSSSRIAAGLWPGAAVLAAASVAIGFACGLKPNYWFRQYHPLFGYEALQGWYALLPNPDSRFFLAQAAIGLLALAGILILPGWLLAKCRSGRRPTASSCRPPM